MFQQASLPESYLLGHVSIGFFTRILFTFPAPHARSMPSPS